MSKIAVSQKTNPAYFSYDWSSSCLKQHWTSNKKKKNTKHYEMNEADFYLDLFLSTFTQTYNF